MPIKKKNTLGAWVAAGGYAPSSLGAWAVANGLAPRDPNTGAPSAPAPAAAAAPAPAAPTRTPRARVGEFFTPDDIIGQGEWMRSANDARDTAASGLNTAVYETGFQNEQLARQAQKGLSDTADSMAARGMFQSSLKDGAVNDIQAQKTLNQGLLSSRLNTVATDYNTFVDKYGGTLADTSTGKLTAKTRGRSADDNGTEGIGREVAAWWQAQLGKKAENAQRVNNDLAADDALDGGIPGPPAPTAPPVPGAAAIKPITYPKHSLGYAITQNKLVSNTGTPSRVSPTQVAGSGGLAMAPVKPKPPKKPGRP